MTTTSKMQLFVAMINDFHPETKCREELYLRSCGGPRYVSDYKKW